MFKKAGYLATICASIFLFSCGENEGVSEQLESQEMTMGEVSSAPETPTGPLDPICDMEKTDEWELFSMYEEDTVWFCSEFCKETFDNNQEKYAAKLN